MPRRLVREVFSMWKWLETFYSILVLNVKCNNNLCISNILVWLSMSSGVEFRLLLTTQESCGFRDIKSCAPHVNAKIKQITPNYHINQLLSNKHVLHSCFLEPKELVNHNNKNTCIPHILHYGDSSRQSTRLKSKALGFFANLGWTNLSGSTKQTLNQTVAKSIYSNRKCWRRYGEIWPLYFYRFVRQLIGLMISLDDCMLKHYR